MLDQLKNADLWTSRELAEYLSVPEQSVRALRQSGGGPPFVRIGRSRFGGVRYLRSDVAKWLEDRRRRSTAEETVEGGAA